MDAVARTAALDLIKRLAYEYAEGIDTRTEAFKLAIQAGISTEVVKRLLEKVARDKRKRQAELTRTLIENERRANELAAEARAEQKAKLESEFLGEPSGAKKILGEPQPEAEPAKPEQPSTAVGIRRLPRTKPEEKQPEPEPKAKAAAEPEPSRAGASSAASALVRFKAQKDEQRGLVVAPSTALVVEPEIQGMNDRHAVISNLGGKCVIMEWVPSTLTEGATELSYQSFTSFRERYSNRYITVPNARRMTENVPLAPYWLAHPGRRQYEGLDLVPNGPAVLPGGYLNLWRGWGVEPRKGSWRLMERHIAEVLANGDQQFEDYIRRWIAWKFQNPALPLGVVLALLGGKGAGKGVFGYCLMLAFGQHGLQVFSSSHLYGKHNQHLQNKLFLFLDEAMWAGDREGERVLKGIATEKWMMIEPKNINAFQWPNRLGVLMSGNDKWIVPASHDERRYAVNKISERWKQNKDYFRPLFEEVNNGGAGAMLYDLLALNLDGWHPMENVPQTGR
jgi:hypothetical protein